MSKLDTETSLVEPKGSFRRVSQLLLSMIVAPWAGKGVKSCAVIGYPSWTTRRVPQETFPGKPYSKSFIYQTYPVKLASYWPRSFFCKFMDLDSVQVHKHANEELDQYSAILTSHLVNKPYPRGTDNFTTFFRSSIAEYFTCLWRFKDKPRGLHLIMQFYWSFATAESHYWHS